MHLLPRRAWIKGQPVGFDGPRGFGPREAAITILIAQSLRIGLKRCG